MSPLFEKILAFAPRSTNVGGQKIDQAFFRTYKMALASFLLQDSLRRVQFFEKIVWLPNIDIKVVFGMSFLFLSNIDVKFGIEELIWRRSIGIETISIVKQVELINKFKFIKVALDKDSKIYVVYIAALKITNVFNNHIKPNHWIGSHWRRFHRMILLLNHQRPKYSYINMYISAITNSISTMTNLY